MKNHLSFKHGKKKVITEDVRDNSCKKCNYNAMSKIQLANHMKLIHQQFSEKNETISGERVEKETEEHQYNCNACDYQGTNKYQLEKHIQLKHTVNGIQSVETIKCRNCGDLFCDRRNFMNHRKSQHVDLVALCRNFLDGKCVFSKHMCWWKHEESDFSNLTQKQSCYVCNDRFKEKNDLMIHRKKHHPRIVKDCSKFSEENCRFRSDTCWFIHRKDETDNKQEGEEEEHNEENVGQLVFQKVPEKQKAPLNNSNQRQ